MLLANHDHDRISPTARMVAYFRSFSDIPYANEVSEILSGEEVAREIYGEDLALMTDFAAPFAEARYRSFDRFTASHNNILELAMGTSIERGLSICADPRKVYVGTDLPETIAQLRVFFDTTSQPRRVNYHLEPVNVLSHRDLDEAAAHFSERKGLLVVCEGLWMYLTADEQVLFARNMRRLLERFGGTWVVPDIIDSESYQQLLVSLGPEMTAAHQNLMRRTAHMTGRNVESNYFRSSRDASAFFNKSGFDVRRYAMVDDVASMTAARRLWGSRERDLYESALTQQRVWAMSPS